MGPIALLERGMDHFFDGVVTASTYPRQIHQLHHGEKPPITPACKLLLLLRAGKSELVPFLWCGGWWGAARKLL